MINITWYPMRKNGYRNCEFEYEGQIIQMKACDVIVNSWRSQTDADAWAQKEAQKIIDRTEWEKSPEGQEAAAEEELILLEQELEVKQGLQNRIEEIKNKYPKLKQRG